MDAVRQGKLIVISGPSGSGKTTLVERLLDNPPEPVVLSISATTRRPRRGEVEGVDYHFLTPEEFRGRRERGEFLECFEVYEGGHWYGTLRSEVTPSLEAGKWVLLEIDVQGTKAILRSYPDAVTIFVRPSSVDELERRLRARGTESEASIQHRLEGARRELEQAHLYRFQVVNDDVARALDEIKGILTGSGV